MEPTAAPGMMQELIIRFLSGVTAATVVLVGADLAWSRFSWHRDLRMTKQEVKDEHKQMEGDPMVKIRLRSLQRDRSRKRMMAAVPRATLIAANPTHYSVALGYVREEGGAPIVGAKGKDLIALKIRFIAEQNGIPYLRGPCAGTFALRKRRRGSYDPARVSTRPLPASSCSSPREAKQARPAM